MIRFLRGWDSEGGSRFADLEIATRGDNFSARAWRSHNTCELDFDRPSERQPAPIELSWASELADELRGTPFGLDIEILRLRFAADTPLESTAAPNTEPTSHRTGYLLEPLPELPWRGGDLPEVNPLSRSTEAAFMSTFKRIFAAEALGMGAHAGVSDLATGLYRGAPIEGWTGYRGFMVGNPENPIGTFFVGPAGDPPLSFGLAGLVPEVRRARLGLAAAVAVAGALPGLGARALQFEIDRRNSESLALARRRGAAPIYQVIVLALGDN